MEKVYVDMIPHSVTDTDMNAGCYMQTKIRDIEHKLSFSLVTVGNKKTIRAHTHIQKGKQTLIQ